MRSHHIAVGVAALLTAASSATKNVPPLKASANKFKRVAVRLMQI
jgi:hypothetical protein